MVLKPEKKISTLFFYMYNIVNMETIKLMAFEYITLHSKPSTSILMMIVSTAIWSKIWLRVADSTFPTI